MKRLELRIFIDVDSESSHYKDFKDIEQELNRYIDIKRIDLIDEIPTD